MTSSASSNPKSPLTPTNSTAAGSREAPDGAAAAASDAIQDILKKPSHFAESGAHFLAGAIGAITAATATAPLDVLRTRFQSDYYKAYLNEARLARGVADPSTLSFHRSAALHIRETFQVLFAIPRVEGYRGLFKGLPAQLVGIVPARGISFFTYGTSKRLITETFSNGVEGPLVHLSSAAMAVAVTASATNPIWVIKTRLQLDQRRSATGAGPRQYKSAMDCLAKTVRAEGVRGLYTGLSASLLGISESASQWMLYEEAKKRLRVRRAAIEDGSIDRAWIDHVLEPFGDSVAAAGAKFIAAIATYPHEVVRTKLRESPQANGKRKYTGLIQTFSLVFKQEGLAGLYGGLIPQMMRVVPNAAIMFGTYEFVLRRLLGEKREERL